MPMRGWSSDLNVNNPMMDKDHQKMVEMIGTLYESMKKGQSKSVLTPLISELSNYAETHFAREEEYLLTKNHPDLASQKKQHDAFLLKVNEFKTNVDSGNTMVAIQLLPFLNEWFVNHIMAVDMRYK